MCRIKGCYGKSVAHGLCQKHYMRLRRHGDPKWDAKPGPKPLEWRKEMREKFFPEMSPRTWARYCKAFLLLHSPGVSNEDRNWAFEQASRPNGSVNVSKLLDIA